MKKLKALFINLPVPDYYRIVQRGNTQLFSDYLRVAVGQEFVEMLKLPRDILEAYNDRALAAAICDLKPDLVGFSSYLWNRERNVAISRYLRAAGILTLTGGPEVTDDNIMHLAGHFDFCFAGAGEQSMHDFLLGLAGADGKPESLGTERFVKSGAQIDFSPLLPGYLACTEDYKYDRLFYLEVERGCPFKCSYCAYGKFNDKIISLDPVIFRQSLERIFPLDIDEIYLLAPTLNRNRQNFNRYLDEIIGLKQKTGKAIRIFAELRAGLVKDAEISRMALAGFHEIEFGIQSLHKQAFQSPDPQDNGFDFIGFADKLLTAGITPAIDFIVGLPHDTPANIIDTIELLDKHKLLGYANFYHLHVLPGTDIRTTFDANGYAYDQEPPYLAYEVDTLAFPEMQEIYYHLEEEKGLTFISDFYDYLPEQYYIIHSATDLAGLAATPYYHSASLVLLDNLASSSVLGFFENFFKEHPEIFHRVFLYSGHKIDFDFLEALHEICCKYKNYYDLYKDSINFDLASSFSKVVHTLVNPNVSARYREELAEHCLVDFLLLPEEKDLYAKYEALFYTCFSQEGNYVYVYKNSLSARAPWLRELPVEK